MTLMSNTRKCKMRMESRGPQTMLKVLKVPRRRDIVEANGRRKSAAFLHKLLRFWHSHNNPWTLTTPLTESSVMLRVDAALVIPCILKSTHTNIIMIHFIWRKYTYRFLLSQDSNDTSQNGIFLFIQTWGLQNRLRTTLQIFILFQMSIKLWATSWLRFNSSSSTCKHLGRQKLLATSSNLPSEGYF